MDELYFKKLELDLKKDLYKRVEAEANHIKNLADIAREYTKNTYVKFLEKIGFFMCKKQVEKRKKNVKFGSQYLVGVRKKCEELMLIGGDIFRIEPLFKQGFETFEKFIFNYLEMIKDGVKTTDLTGIVNLYENLLNNFDECVKECLENDISQLESDITKETEASMNL